jgi:succinate dehydrogenase / fumarate reductase membrane anchor subunit
MSLRTPLGRARGLGSAKEGLNHWWAQRFTAVILVPLLLWFAISVVGLVGAGYDTAAAWVARPLNAVLLLVMLGALFHHAQLGLQVVIEDYVHAEGPKLVTLVLVKVVILLLAVAAALAVLKLAVGGSA